MKKTRFTEEQMVTILRAVVVLDVLRHGLPEMPVSDRNQPIEAFFFD